MNGGRGELKLGFVKGFNHWKLQDVKAFLKKINAFKVGMGTIDRIVLKGLNQDTIYMKSTLFLS